MSLLMNALRTAFAARTWQPPEAPSAEETPGAPPAPPGADQPAWRLLATQTGVQDQVYGDTARANIRALFGRPPRRLLDIGCASGVVAAGLKKAYPGLWAWGCELNPQTARLAAGRLDHVTDVPREQWTGDDLERVRSVDTVLLLDVLEHMYNPWGELEFLARELPADAQVIVSLPNAGHRAVLHQLAHGEFRYAREGILDVTHVRFFTYEGMLAMFRETGFQLEAAVVLSGAPDVQVDRFPARLVMGRLSLDVESAEEWERLHAIQFGFRLRPAREGSAA